MTLSDSVYNKQIMTWQDPDIVFIHLFWYHTAHSLVRSMIPKFVSKNDIKIFPFSNLYIILCMEKSGNTCMFVRITSDVTMRNS